MFRGYLDQQALPHSRSWAESITFSAVAALLHAADLANDLDANAAWARHESRSPFLRLAEAVGMSGQPSVETTDLFFHLRFWILFSSRPWGLRPSPHVPK